MVQRVRVAAVITAAGLSLRFREDKLAYLVEGVPMGVACLRQYARIPLCKRVLVTDKARAYMHREAEKLDYTLCFNLEPQRGLSSSVMLGTECISKEEAEGLLYGVADQPFLRDESLFALIQAFEQEPDCIWALEAEGKQGKPVIFPMIYREELLKLQGDIGGKSVLLRHKDKLRTVSVSVKELKDLDTREDI